MPRALKQKVQIIFLLFHFSPGRNSGRSTDRINVTSWWRCMLRWPASSVEPAKIDTCMLIPTPEIAVGDACV